MGHIFLDLLRVRNQSHFLQKAGRDHVVAAIFPHLMSFASAPVTEVAFLKVVWLVQCRGAPSWALCVLGPQLVTGGDPVSHGDGSAFPTGKE